MPVMTMATTAPDRPRWWRRHLTTLLTVTALLAVAVAYAARPADAVQLDQVRQQLLAGIMAERAAAVAVLLSPDYRDNHAQAAEQLGYSGARGVDRDNAIRFLGTRLWGPYDAVRVTVERPQDVQQKFLTRHRAWMRLAVRLTGVGNRKTLDEVYTVELDLRREALRIFSRKQSAALAIDSTHPLAAVVTTARLLPLGTYYLLRNVVTCTDADVRSDEEYTDWHNLVAGGPVGWRVIAARISCRTPGAAI